MDLSQQQAIVPAAPTGGSAPPSTIFTVKIPSCPPPATGLSLSDLYHQHHWWLNKTTGLAYLRNYCHLSSVKLIHLHLIPAHIVRSFMSVPIGTSPTVRSIMDVGNAVPVPRITVILPPTPVLHLIQQQSSCNPGKYPMIWISQLRNTTRCRIGCTFYFLFLLFFLQYKKKF